MYLLVEDNKKKTVSLLWYFQVRKYFLYLIHKLFPIPLLLAVSLQASWEGFVPSFPCCPWEPMSQPFHRTLTCGPLGHGTRLEHLHGLGRSSPWSGSGTAAHTWRFQLHADAKVKSRQTPLCSGQRYRACVLYPALGDLEEAAWKPCL